MPRVENKPDDVTEFEFDTDGGGMAGVAVRLNKPGYTLEMTEGETDEDDKVTFVIRDASGEPVATIGGYDILM